MINNMRIRMKMTVLSAGMMSLLLIVAIVGYFDLRDANNSINDLYQNNLKSIELLSENRAHTRAVEADIYNMIIHIDNKDLVSNVKLELEDRLVAFDNNLKEFETKNIDEYEINELNNLNSNLKEYRDKREEIFNLIWFLAFLLDILFLRVLENLL